MNRYEINKSFKSIAEKEAFVNEFMRNHLGESILMMSSTDNSIVGDGTITLHNITTV